MHSIIRQTHTYAVLQISKTAYDEIAEKLRAVGYDHVFHDREDFGVVIDMHGIALAGKASQERDWSDCKEARGGGRKIGLFRGVDRSHDYVIVETVETIDGPRERVSRRLTQVNPERAAQEFDSAKDALPK